MGRGKEAIATGQKALELEQRASGSNDPDSLWFENNLAMYYRQGDNAVEAARIWADVVERARKQFSHGEWDLAHFLYREGATHAMLGDNRTAARLLSESVKRFTAALGAKNERTLKAKPLWRFPAKLAHRLYEQSRTSLCGCLKSRPPFGCCELRRHWRRLQTNRPKKFCRSSGALCQTEH